MYNPNFVFFIFHVSGVGVTSLFVFSIWGCGHATPIPLPVQKPRIPVQNWTTKQQKYIYNSDIYESVIFFTEGLKSFTFTISRTKTRKSIRFHLYYGYHGIKYMKPRCLRDQKQNLISSSFSMVFTKAVPLNNLFNYYLQI